MKRTLASVFAAVTLAGGLVACTSDEGDTGNGSAASSDASAADSSEGADASGEADASGDASASESDDADDAEGDDAAGGNGETVEQQTADGETVLIPADFKSAIDEASADWGDPETIQQDDDEALATFADGNLLAWGDESGAAPLVGMIGQTWSDEGGLENEVGLPTGPEEELPEGGWTQEFTDGVINWVNEGGEWGPQVEQN